MNTDKTQQNPAAQPLSLKSRAVFIDRDGTLIEEVNFLHRVEELRFFSYTDEAVRLLKENGFFVVLVTNQSGIGRGIYTVEQMNEIHEQIQNYLSAKLDAIYFCPLLPDADCACRKPRLGMIEAACADLPIDLEGSWMIGDKKLDIEFGFNAGIKPILVKTGYGAEHLPQMEKKPEFVAENLLEAARLIIES